MKSQDKDTGPRRSLPWLQRYVPSPETTLEGILFVRQPMLRRNFLIFQADRPSDGEAGFILGRWYYLAVDDRRWGPQSEAYFTQAAATLAAMLEPPPSQPGTAPPAARA